MEWNKKIDASLEISLSEDRMQAFGSFFPPFGEGQLLDRDYADKVLEAAGISFGLKDDILDEAIRLCNEEHKRQEHLLIAEGKPSKPGVSAHIKLRKRFFEKHQPTRDISILKVDYKKESPFIIVKEGERIARRIPENPGEPGCDVTGQELPPETPEMILFEPGENVVEKEEQFFAACAGHFELKDKRFWIHEVLQIQGNVDYHTGHISFPGDVVITGVIRDGFRVASGASVFCKDTLDASEVLARGNLIIDQGIKGRLHEEETKAGDHARSGGLVRVAGRLETKFIENCLVECKGGMIVASSVVNSRILSLGRLEMADDGKILGGELVIEKGLITGSIGRPGSPVAVIKCGYSFVEQRRLETMRQHREVLKKKVEKIEKLNNYRTGKDIEELKQRMEGMLANQDAQIKTLLDKLYNPEGVDVRVTGSVEAGTVIEICNVSYLVKSNLTGVRFFLNTTSGNVEQEPL